MSTDSPDKKTETKMAMACESCGTTWVETYPMPMLVTAFVKRLRAATTCISCGYTPRKNAKKQIVMLTGEAAQRVIEGKP